MIGIMAEFDIKSDCIDKFLEEVKPLVKASNEEAGCIKYELHKALGSDNIFVMVEEWKDQAAIDFHNSSEHFTTIVPRLGALSAKETKVTLMERVL